MGPSMKSGFSRNHSERTASQCDLSTVKPLVAVGVLGIGTQDAYWLASSLVVE